MLLFASLFIAYLLLTKYQDVLFLMNLAIFMSKNNPLLYDEDELNLFYQGGEEDECELDKATVVPATVVPTVAKYEDKYSEKFNRFPNNFVFTEEEVKEEEVVFVRRMREAEETKRRDLEEINANLLKISRVEEAYALKDRSELLKYFDMDEEEEETDDEEEEGETQEEQGDELYTELLDNKAVLEKALVEALNTNPLGFVSEGVPMGLLKDVDIEEVRVEAHNEIVKQKLDKLMNSYVLEHTPVGNIYMRFNNSKKSFEYFSNNTIPYRYLESVSRKYVMTFWCKPIFVSIEDELKKSEEREKAGTDGRTVVALSPVPTPVPLSAVYKTKNRLNSVLPPQIINKYKSNKPCVRELLKENTNQYTWEGRLSGFSPLKPIDRKLVNKQLSLTYEDFKAKQSLVKRMAHNS